MRSSPKFDEMVANFQRCGYIVLHDDGDGHYMMPDLRDSTQPSLDPLQEVTAEDYKNKGIYEGWIVLNRDDVRDLVSLLDRFPVQLVPVKGLSNGNTTI